MHAGDEPLSDAYKQELLGMNMTVRLDSLKGMQAGDPLGGWLIQAPQPNSSMLDTADGANWQVVSQVQA